jgi:psiF repeat
MTQQERVTYRDKGAGARSLEGDARKGFMSECLKSK